MLSVPNTVLAVDSFGFDPSRPQGSAFSPRDTLVALLATGCPLKVLTRKRCVIRDWVPHLNVKEPEWREVREARSWGMAGHVYNKILRRAARGSLLQWRPDLLVVEDPISHRFIEQFRDWTDVPHKAIIVRGTPDQFMAKYGGGVPPQLPKILGELQMYHTFISLSARVADKWKAYDELKGLNYRIIPNCGREEEASVILKQKRDVLRSQLGFASDAFILVCVGSIQRRKGQDLLIDALDALHAVVPNFRLVLVGPVCNEAGGDDVLRRLERHALRDVVTVLGARPDALQITRAADLFILPTREEALPRAVLDAMILGVPVVASAVDGIPELIDSGSEGLLFESDKTELMIEAVRQMANDKAFRSACAERAGRKYWAQFSRARQIERYKAFVSEIMDAKSGVTGSHVHTQRNTVT